MTSYVDSTTALVIETALVADGLAKLLQGHAVAGGSYWGGFSKVERAAASNSRTSSMKMTS